MNLELINLDAVRDAQICTQFPAFVVSDFIHASASASISADYPDIAHRGNFPLSTISYGPSFERFIREIESDEMAAAIGQKLHLDLTGYPTMITARGRIGRKDGRIHRDNERKIVTVLLYLNERWSEPEGRLRLLRSRNLEDYFLEIPPFFGTLVAFLNTPNALHGHKRFRGPRRAIQLNWMQDDAAVEKELRRHRMTAAIKQARRRVWTAVSFQ